ncbi:MAG TPA: hypothetical protein VII95_09880 [Terriglobales bacterium]
MRDGGVLGPPAILRCANWFRPSTTWKKPGLLPQEFAVLGVAHEDLGLEEFRKRVTCFLEAEDHGTEAWDRFQQCLHYQRGDFGDEATYAKLGESLAAIDRQHGTSQNYLYLYGHLA